MRPLIEEISQGSLSADENSLYRALSRFQNMEIVASETQPSKQGPYRRYYHLTDKGLRLLRRFVEGNIHVFASPAVASRIASRRRSPPDTCLGCWQVSSPWESVSYRCCRGNTFTSWARLPCFTSVRTLPLEYAWQKRRTVSLISAGIQQGKSGIICNTLLSGLYITIDFIPGGNPDAAHTLPCPKPGRTVRPLLPGRLQIFPLRRRRPRPGQ